MHHLIWCHFDNLTEFVVAPPLKKTKKSIENQFLVSEDTEHDLKWKHSGLIKWLKDVLINHKIISKCDTFLTRRRAIIRMSHNFTCNFEEYLGDSEFFSEMLFKKVFVKICHKPMRLLRTTMENFHLNYEIGKYNLINTFFKKAFQTLILK